MMVWLIARDLRRTVDLFQHEQTHPLVQERQARKRPAKRGSCQQRIARTVGARDDERQPRSRARFVC